MKKEEPEVWLVISKKQDVSHFNEKTKAPRGDKLMVESNHPECWDYTFFIKYSDLDFKSMFSQVEKENGCVPMLAKEAGVRIENREINRLVTSVIT